MIKVWEVRANQCEGGGLCIIDCFNLYESESWEHSIQVCLPKETRTIEIKGSHL